MRDDLEPDGRLRARPRRDVAVAEARGQLDQGRVLEGGLAGRVAEDLVLDGGRAGAVGGGGEGGAVVGRGERGREGGGLRFFFFFSRSPRVRSDLRIVPSRFQFRPLSEFRSPLFTGDFPTPRTLRPTRRRPKRALRRRAGGRGDG